MALNDLANQVAALKTSIETALATALDKNEAIAAAAYAKALQTLVMPDGVVSLIDEADTQIARVTAEGDTQDALIVTAGDNELARIAATKQDNIITGDTTIPADSGETYFVTADAIITIPDDRPAGWRVLIVAAAGVTATLNLGNNTLPAMENPGDTPTVSDRDSVLLRTSAANTFEVY